MAGEGLLNETAIELNTDLDVSTYANQAIVLDYLNTVAVLESDLYDVTTNPDGISQALIDSFIYALDTTAPYLTNVNPLAQGIDTHYYDTFLNTHIDNMFPSVGQYITYLQIAMGHMDVANTYVNSAVNGAALTEQTFTSGDALMSGNITALSTDVHAFATELVNTGFLFSFTKVDNIGTPQALLESLMSINMIATIADELEAQGVDMFDLQAAINDNPESILKPAAQKRCYDAFVTVTGAKLEQILSVMQFTTTGITALSDLLDLTKIFPTTYTTLTAPNNGTLENIYINATDIAPYVAAYDLAAPAVMPPDQTRANIAFAISLGQIKGIINSSPQQLGEAATAIESNSGLTNTSALTEALPASTSAFFLAEMGGGTGPDGTFYLTDLVGTPAGVPHVANQATLNSVISTWETTGELDWIHYTLEVIRDVVAGVYTVADPPPTPPDPQTYHVEIPNPHAVDPSIPGNGIHADKTAALVDLIDTVLPDGITVLTDANLTDHADATAAYIGSITSIKTELEQLWESEVRFEVTYLPGFETADPLRNGIPANKKTTLAFAENLHQHGKKTSKGDVAEILEILATDTQGGDAIIGAMREGRNLDKLNEANVSSDNLINDQPSTVEPGNIS